MAKGGKLPVDVKGGLSESYSFADYSLKECALDSKGPNQRPMGIKKGAVSEKEPLSPGRPGGLRWR